MLGPRSDDSDVILEVTDDGEVIQLEINDPGLNMATLSDAPGNILELHPTGLYAAPFDDSDIVNALGEKVGKQEGKGLSANDFTDQLLGKLGDIEDGATKNRADSENANAQHGHSIEGVDGLEQALGGKVSKEEGKALSANDFTNQLLKKLGEIEEKATNTVIATTLGQSDKEAVSQKLLTGVVGDIGMILDNINGETP